MNFKSEMLIIAANLFITYINTIEGTSDKYNIELSEILLGLSTSINNK